MVEESTDPAKEPTHASLVQPIWWRRSHVRMRYALFASLIGLLSAALSVALSLGLPQTVAVPADGVANLLYFTRTSGRIIACLFTLIAGGLGLYLAFRSSRHHLVILLATACASGSACAGLFQLRLAVRTTFEAGHLAPFSLHASLNSTEFTLTIMLLIVTFGLIAFAASTMFYTLFPQRVTVFDRHLSKELSKAAEFGKMALDEDGRNTIQELKRKGPGELLKRAALFLAWPPITLLIIYSVIGFAPAFVYDGLADTLIAHSAAVAGMCFFPFMLMYAKRRHLGQDDQAILNWILLGQTITVFVFALIAMVLIVWAAELRLPVGRVDSFYSAYASVTTFQFLGVFHMVSLMAIASAILSKGVMDPGLIVRRTWVIGLTALVVGVIFVMLERLAAGWLIRALGMSSDTALLLIGALVAASFFPIRSWSEKRIKALFDRYMVPESFAHGERESAAVVFSDLSGYSALSASNEGDALLTVALFHRAAKLHAPDFDGQVIKTIGDAVMMTFPDASKAVEATRRIHADYTTKASAVLNNPLQPHAGIHMGEVIRGDDGDVYGATVNIAARLQSQANKGEIVLSEAVQQGLRADEPLRALGPLSLKNIPEPVLAFSAAG